MDHDGLVCRAGETPLFDGLGSRRTGTDSTGAVTGGQTADAFGCPVTSDGAAPTAQTSGWNGGSGYQTDADTRLTLCGNRYYAADLSRFLSPNPARSGSNCYAASRRRLLHSPAKGHSTHSPASCGRAFSRENACIAPPNAV